MILGRTMAVLACCAPIAFGAWPTYHGEADLKGISDAALPAQPTLLWRHNAGGAVYNAPVSDGALVFFSAKKGRIAAIDLGGAAVWSKTFSRTNDAGQEMAVRFDAPLACGGGLVFAGSVQGTLYALDGGTGGVRWCYETGGTIIGSPSVVSNRVLVLDQSEGALHAVDVATGKRVWKTEGVERCDGAPGVGGGRVVFGSCLAALHVYSFGDGAHLKDVELGGDGQVAGGVAVAGDTVFAGARDGQLVCADVASGVVLWSSAESESQTFSTPAVAADKVVYSSDDGLVYAVDRQSGALRWTFKTGGLPTSCVVAQGAVVVSADGALFMLDLADGRKLWSAEVSDEISSPSLIAGMIVVGADDGTVSAFGSKK